MNKQLIKTFSEIKIQCKTRKQRILFNRILSTFALNLVPDQKDIQRAKTCPSEQKAIAMSKSIKDISKCFRRGLAFITHGKYGNNPQLWASRLVELGADEELINKFNEEVLKITGNAVETTDIPAQSKGSSDSISKPGSSSITIGDFTIDPKYIKLAQGIKNDKEILSKLKSAKDIDTLIQLALAFIGYSFPDKGTTGIIERVRAWDEPRSNKSLEYVRAPNGGYIYVEDPRYSETGDKLLVEKFDSLGASKETKDLFWDAANKLAIDRLVKWMNNQIYQDITRVDGSTIEKLNSLESNQIINLIKKSTDKHEVTSILIYLRLYRADVNVPEKVLEQVSAKLGITLAERTRLIDEIYQDYLEDLDKPRTTFNTKEVQDVFNFEVIPTEMDSAFNKLKKRYKMSLSGVQYTSFDRENLCKILSEAIIPPFKVRDTEYRISIRKNGNYCPVIHFSGYDQDGNYSHGECFKTNCTVVNDKKIDSVELYTHILNTIDKDLVGLFLVTTFYYECLNLFRNSLLQPIGQKVFELTRVRTTLGNRLFTDLNKSVTLIPSSCDNGSANFWRDTANWSNKNFVDNFKQNYKSLFLGIERQSKGILLNLKKLYELYPEIKYEIEKLFKMNLSELHKMYPYYPNKDYAVGRTIIK